MNRLQAAEAMVIYKRKFGENATIYYSEQRDDYVCQVCGILTDDYEKLLECPIDEPGAHPEDATDEDLIWWLEDVVIPFCLEKRQGERK